MTAFESDWVFLREALPLLRDYVLSKDVYWPIRQPARSPSGLQIPQLTIGNVRLSLARLSALALADKAKTELDDLQRRVEQLCGEWRANWGNKAAREYESRLNLWQQNVRDLRADPKGQATFYASEVRQRALLHLLRPELNGPPQPGQEAQLAQLDQVLRGISHPGAFVWEPEARASFPPEDFWFLYVRL